MKYSNSEIILNAIKDGNIQLNTILNIPDTRIFSREMVLEVNGQKQKYDVLHTVYIQAELIACYEDERAMMNLTFKVDIHQYFDLLFDAQNLKNIVSYDTVVGKLYQFYNATLEDNEPIEFKVFSDICSEAYLVNTISYSSSKTKTSDRAADECYKESWSHMMRVKSN